MTPISNQAITSAVKNVISHRPAHISPREWSIGRAIMRFIYSALKLGPTPEDAAAHDMSVQIEKYSSQILHALASIQTDENGHFSEGRHLFEVEGHIFRFVEKNGRVSLQDGRRNLLSTFEGNTPAELQSTGIRALLKYEASNLEKVDLTKFSLCDLIDPDLVNFNNAKLNCHSISDLACTESAISGKLINLRGATFVQSADGEQQTVAELKPYLAEINWKSFLIDRQFALDLIKAGADPAQILAQYIFSERNAGEVNVDISDFDLTKIDLTEMDLRGLNLKAVVAEGSSAVLKNLRAAVLDKSVRSWLSAKKPDYTDPLRREQRLEPDQDELHGEL